MAEEVDGSDVDVHIADLETKLFHNVYQYELHLKYIKCLKEKGNFMKLRHARERFSKNFPLSEDLWMQWIKDEECIDMSLNQLQYIKELFDRAHLDYLCPDLWVEEIRFFLEHLKERNAFGTKPDDEDDDSSDDDDDDDNDDDDDGEAGDGKGMKQTKDMDTDKDKKTLVTIAFVREICENAVAACSKHFAKAGAVFDQYELFEFAVLEHIAALGDAEALEEQKRHITALHRRRLGLPHRGLGTGWASFIQWLAVQGLDADEKAKQRYNRAADKADHYEHLEGLLAAEDARAQRDAYMRYIEEEKKEGAERAATAYERAITALPLDTPLWIDYLVFLTTTGKAAQALPLVARAWRRSVRNCPWSSELWRHRIAQEERSGAAYTAVKPVLEEALQMPFQTPQDYVRVWLAFCHFCFRRTQAEAVVKTDADEDVVETWRMAVTGAKEYVAQYLQPETPGYNTVCLYEAKMEALHFSNLEHAHSVMEELLRTGTFGKELETWLAFYQLERIAAGVAGARKVLQRAVQFVRDAPEAVVQLYAQFEDENGTLADVDEAARRCHHALQTAAAARRKAEAKWNKKGGDKKSEAKQRGKRKQGERKAKQQQQQDQRKGGKAGASTAGPGDDREAEGEELQRKRAKVVSYESLEQRQEEGEGGDGSKKEEQATTRGEGKGRKHDDQQQEAQAPEHPANDPQTAKRTVFVKNLDFSVDEDMLQTFFKDCGSIKEIRLVRKASGKSKGFAYIEFEEKSSLSFALSKDRQFLHGRPVFVDPCVDRSKVALKPKHKTGYDPRTVFAKSLDYSSTEEEVRKLFEQYGPVKEVRMMTTPAGKPRGFAYVEFEASRDAASAIMNLDKTQFKGRPLQVSLSNPPSSAQGTGGHAAPAGRPVHVGDAGAPSLSSSSAFQPRSIRKAQRSGRGRLALNTLTTATKSSASASSGTGEQPKNQDGAGAGKPKSNADFLSMMLRGKKGPAK